MSFQKELALLEKAAKSAKTRAKAPAKKKTAKKAAKKKAPPKRRDTPDRFQAVRDAEEALLRARDTRSTRRLNDAIDDLREARMRASRW
jgi:hypothetical protein